MFAGSDGKKGIPNCIAVRNTSLIFCRKSRIEVAVADELLEQVIEAIGKSASTGKIGDGKIFVVDLEQAVRIRTGETGVDAL